MLWHKIALGAVPLVLLLNVYQSKRFRAVDRQLDSLERQRSQLIDENKRLVAEIAVLSSPRRIDDLSLRSPHLSAIRPEQVLRIILPEEKINP